MIASRAVKAVVTAALVASLVSCDPNSGGTSDTADGPMEIPSTAVAILGTSDALAVVVDLEVLPDGTVWVLNSLAPFFVGFDASGDVIAAHGVEGGGPEEYRLPSAFVTGGLDGEAWVLDVRRHSLIRVSKPDQPWSEIRLPRGTLPPGTVQGGMDLMSSVVRTARLGPEVILPRSTGTLESGVFTLVEKILKADLMRFDPATEVVERVLTLGAALEDPFTGFEATEGGFPLWKRLWSACGPDQLRAYDRVRNQLRGFDRSGMELRPIDLPAPQFTEVTPREFARAVFALRQAEATGAVGNRLNEADSLRLINEMVQGVKGDPSQLAAYLPRYVDFRCSDDGTMWLQPFDIDAGGLRGGRVWHRISSEGRFRMVTLPENFDALRFTVDRVWGVQRDELDLASIAWAPIPSG